MEDHTISVQTCSNPFAFSDSNDIPAYIINEPMTKKNSALEVSPNLMIKFKNVEL